MPENSTAADTTQTTIPFPSPDQEQLNISTLETWLWDAAGEISFHAHPMERLPGMSLKVHIAVKSTYDLVYKWHQICNIYDTKFIDNNGCFRIHL